jgi:hypothetical protein
MVAQVAGMPVEEVLPVAVVTATTVLAALRARLARQDRYLLGEPQWRLQRGGRTPMREIFSRYARDAWLPQTDSACPGSWVRCDDGRGPNLV